ncbi:MAG: hypothetical protein IPI04_16205 [Ignavibacteria bacterium]|nr:hypothetical protein [Ignavibacteria bacterium]
MQLTQVRPGNLNDVNFGLIPLPFIYTFNCIDYTSYFVNTNGFITFAIAPVPENTILFFFRGVPREA